MAMQEWSLRGDGFALMEYLNDKLLQSSLSSSLEDACAYEVNGVRCLFRVYERYSALGSNRLSLSIMLLQHEENLQLTAITAGGSEALFFKMNTLGEHAFLEVLSDAVSRWVG